MAAIPKSVHSSAIDFQPLDEITDLSAGDTHTCALTTSENVKCWGNGTYGQLGNNESGYFHRNGHWVDYESTTPVDVHTSSTDSNPLSGIASISAGDKHTCALTTSGNVKCWGYGHYGQLGDGVADDSYYDDGWVYIPHTSSTPVDVHTSSTNSNPLSGIAAISSGSSYTCALTTGGNVKCWGAGHSGQLGNDSYYSDSLTPVDVHTSSTDSNPLSGIASISAGYRHTCSLTTGGNIKCWGYGHYGQLGDGVTGGSLLTPVDVHTSSTNSNPLSGIEAISASHDYTCALTGSGNVKCWGDGRMGQLGNGESGDNYYQSTSVDVRTSSSDLIPLSGISAISTEKHMPVPSQQVVMSSVGEMELILN